MQIQLRKTEELKPHERISQRRFETLLKKISKEKVYTTPIVIDAKTNVIIDGHHRQRVLRALGVKEIPCLCIDYLSDTSVKLIARKEERKVSKKEVIARGIAGEPYPYKTTKHTYAEKFPVFEPVAIHPSHPEGKKPFIAMFVKKELIAGRTYMYTFSKPRKYLYTAGSYTFLTPGLASHLPGRYLSIESAPHERELRFVLREGKTIFKKTLMALKKGDSVRIEAPGNNFSLPQKESKGVVFIAGGVGVAPFMSLLAQQHKENSKRKITLFVANRTPKTAPFSTELSDIEAHMPNFSFVPVMTRLSQAARWEGERGHITSHMIQQYVRDYMKRTYYIAGAQPMVSSVKAVLLELGIPAKQIQVEHFCGFNDYLCTHCLQRYTRSLIVS